MAKRVAYFVGDGTEPVETVAPVDILRRGGVDVRIVSVMPTVDVAMGHGMNLRADALQEEIDPDAFDMVVVPGGIPGVDNLGKSEVLSAMLKDFIAKGKHVASICAGPTILAKLGLLDGRKATCYPGCQKAFPEGSYADVIGVVVDGNLITASGPGIALDFGVACLRALAGDSIADSVASGMLIDG